MNNAFRIVVVVAALAVCATAMATVRVCPRHGQLDPVALPYQPLTAGPSSEGPFQ